MHTNAQILPLNHYRRITVKDMEDTYINTPYTYTHCAHALYIERLVFNNQYLPLNHYRSIMARKTGLRNMHAHVNTHTKISTHMYISSMYGTLFICTIVRKIGLTFLHTHIHKHSTHTYMSLNHNRHTIVKETGFIHIHRHPHRYIQAFTKHTDILIPYQTHTYHTHAQTTYIYPHIYSYLHIPISDS